MQTNTNFFSRTNSFISSAASSTKEAVKNKFGSNKLNGRKTSNIAEAEVPARIRSDSFSSLNASHSSSSVKSFLGSVLKRENKESKKADKLFKETFSSEFASQMPTPLQTSPSSAAAAAAPSKILLEDQKNKAAERLGAPAATPSQLSRPSLYSANSPVQISPKDQRALDDFMKKNRSTFLKPGFQRQTFSAENKKNKLPFDVDAFKAPDGQLHVMVQTKKILGQGQSKTASVAVDWESKELFAELTVSNSLINPNRKQEFATEIALQNALQGSEGIAKPFIGHREDGESAIAYQSLYQGTADKLIDLRPEEKNQLMSDLAHGLASLQKAGIEHKDIKLENVFIHNDGNGPRAALFDFGLASKVGGKDYKALKEGMVDGNEAYASPQMKRAADIAEDISRNQAQYKTQLDALKKANPEDYKSQEAALKEQAIGRDKQLKQDFVAHLETHALKNDTWSMGLNFLSILDPSGSTHKEISGLFDIHDSAFTVLDNNYKKGDPHQDKFDHIFSRENEPLFQASVNEKLDALAAKITNPQEQNQLNVIRQMLTVDAEARITPHEVIRQLVGP